MPILDHFGVLAPFYDRVIQPKDPQVLWNLAELPARGWLLDAGGGTGRIAQFMRQQTDQVVVADLSLQMLQHAQAKGGLHAVGSHIEHLPFADGFFARILMVDALHHVCDQSKTALELWRVLAPGGVMVIEEPDVRTFVVKLVAVAEKLALMRSHFLSPPAIAALFDPCLEAEVRLHAEQNGFNAWVIVKKPG
jgi:demethylmenaquinone methyltransferase/2-methoxy-6-polyprenyl-1,4-benzoquinol methylase